MNDPRLLQITESGMCDGDETVNFWYQVKGQGYMRTNL